MPAAKCMILLSEKSSGSSACQDLLRKFTGIKCVAKTRHHQNETLYWVKAAAILGLPQRNMLSSEVPIERQKAKADLISLLVENLENYSPPSDDKELIFDGWRLLCEQHGPVFFEKSPHHLCQWSALELIVECIDKNTGIDFLLLGLIRNPMDTIYSQFTRWKAPPEELQYQWLVAYRNLLRLKNIVGDKLVIVRYEDVVTSVGHLKPVLDFCGAKVDDAGHHYLYDKSISKWKSDRFFGFALSDEVVELARNYGYDNDELVNRSTLLWPFYRDLMRVGRRISSPVKMFRKKSVARLKSIVGKGRDMGG